MCYLATLPSLRYENSKHMCEQKSAGIIFLLIFVQDTILVFLAKKFLLMCKSSLFVTTTIAWKVLAQLCFSTISIKCDSHDPKPSPFWLHQHIFANTFPNLQSFSEEIIPLTWPLANVVWKGNSFETYNGYQFSHKLFCAKKKLQFDWSGSSAASCWALELKFLGLIQSN